MKKPAIGSPINVRYWLGLKNYPYAQAATMGYFVSRFRESAQRRKLDDPFRRGIAAATQEDIRNEEWFQDYHDFGEVMVIIGSLVDLSDPKSSPQRRNSAAKFLANRMSTHLANPQKRRELKELARTLGRQGEGAKKLLREQIFTSGLLLASQEAHNPQRIRIGQHWLIDAMGDVLPTAPVELDLWDFIIWLEARARIPIDSDEGIDHAESIPLDELPSSESDVLDRLLRCEQTEEEKGHLVKLFQVVSKQEHFLLHLALKEDGELDQVGLRAKKSPPAMRQLRSRLRQKLLKLGVKPGRHPTR